MKAKLLVLALTTVLVSCAGQNNGGTKVSREKFMEECRKIEDHTYASAVVKVKGKRVDAGVESNMDYTFHFEWNSILKAFKCTDDIPESDPSYGAMMTVQYRISFTLKDIVQAYDADPSPVPEGTEMNFWINPFKAETKKKVDDNNYNYETIKYDKYGYVTYDKTDMKEAHAEQVYGGNYVATVTYADA